MTKQLQTTDDASFRIYLNKLSHCSLFEHAKAIMFPDLLVEIMLTHAYMHDDCVSLMNSDNNADAPKLNQAAFETLLRSKSEEAIRELMCQLFSKHLIISTLLKYTDDYAREDIIYNQDLWNQGINAIDHLN